MTAYFESASVKNLPYRIRLDSDDLYVPDRTETKTFFSWLEGAIQQIHARKPGWCWHIDHIPGTQSALYSTFYPIHESTQENDPRATYQINIEGPINQEYLELRYHLKKWGDWPPTGTSKYSRKGLNLGQDDRRNGP